MPISRGEFESGSIDLGFHILAGLEANRSWAWSLDELIEVLQERLAMEIQPDVLLPGLRALELAGKIETKQIWGKDYWIAKQE